MVFMQSSTIANLQARLLFNSLDKLQTKPVPLIRHICDFSRGVLNVRLKCSHPTLAPRPQICLIRGTGFWGVCFNELNSKEFLFNILYTLVKFYIIGIVPHRKLWWLHSDIFLQ